MVVETKPHFQTIKNIMELNLDLTLSSVPKTVSFFLNGVSQTKDISHKLSMLDDLIQRFEEELKKVVAFKRELPLCILLVNDAIVRLKEEKVRLMGIKDLNYEGNENGNGKGSLTVVKENCDDNKKNWLSSFQLWNTEKKSKNEDDNDKSNGEGVFGGFNGNSCVSSKGATQVPSFSLVSTPVSEVSNGNFKSGGGGGGSSASSLLQNNQPQPPQPLQQNPRKQRRCWSSELHRRFVDALQQLGGAHATPKQIREKMQVDGLTNDEVKSHLQKYRLHVRRFPISSIEEANKLALYMAQDQCGGDISNSKGSLSESVSPQGPLTPLLIGGSVARNSVDAEDEQSDCRNWKSEIQHEADNHSL
ncbi:transcription factor HHO5 isoform X2 [Cicer arietinum]|uniref:Transcription factor HHO5 isoform X2 n=1 Tax=Cicer arietinum TaxID=3827 RepID=A0A1S2YYK3_CICAR|nr:transcription factor HHO5 isoform X2 [Cicer arietinum]